MTLCHDGCDLWLQGLGEILRCAFIDFGLDELAMSAKFYTPSLCCCQCVFCTFADLIALRFGENRQKMKRELIALRKINCHKLNFAFK